MDANEREVARADMMDMIKNKGTASVRDCMKIFEQHYAKGTRRWQRLDAVLASMETEGLVACQYTESGRVLSVKARE